MNVVVNFKIPDLLVDKEMGVHVSELSKLSGCEEGKLGRIMRLLATQHCFREMKRDVFANNRLSALLVSSNSLSDITVHLTGDMNKYASVLFDTLKDSDWGHSYATNQTAFNMYSKYPGTIFDYYETPKGSRQRERFGRVMPAWNNGTEASSVVHEYPWHNLPKGATVCDVGGGIGHISVQLTNMYPDLKIVLQDSPQTIQQAMENFSKFCPKAIENQTVQFKAFDFFVEAPVPKCDVYFLKHILHNWPDKECVTILKGIKSVMSPTSRVLIHEYILQHANKESGEAATELAPEPLLPNYGAGGIRRYNLDLDMMILFNSEQRHLEQFIDLGEQAGLKFVKVWDLKEMGLVEFALA